MTSGGLGAVVSNPADKIMVEFQTDGMRPKKVRKNYRGFSHAAGTMLKEQGIKSFFRGALSSVARSALLTAGQLCTNSQITEMLVNRGFDPYGIETKCLAKGLAGFFASFLSLPFENTKIRLMAMKKDKATGLMPYKNMPDAMQKIIRKEGFSKLWVGFPMWYIRIAPHVMSHLLILDWFN